MAALSEARVRTARPKQKPYKLFDERGLYLRVELRGGRLWRFRYRYGGVEKLLALGAYPDVSLKRARQKRDDARRLLADGIDPSAQRQAERIAQHDTFEGVAREWLARQRASLAAETVTLLGARFENYLYPYHRQPSDRGDHCARAARGASPRGDSRTIRDRSSRAGIGGSRVSVRNRDRSRRA